MATCAISRCTVLRFLQILLKRAVTCLVGFLFKTLWFEHQWPPFADDPFNWFWVPFWTRNTEYVLYCIFLHTCSDKLYNWSIHTAVALFCFVLYSSHPSLLPDSLRDFQMLVRQDFPSKRTAGAGKSTVGHMFCKARAQYRIVDYELVSHYLAIV